MTPYQEFLLQLMLGVCGLVISACTTVAVAYMSQKTKSDKMKNALQNLKLAVDVTVGKLQQTVVDGLKAASADGKLTEDEIKALGISSFNNVLKNLDPASRDILQAGYGDLEGLVDDMVQNAVKRLKSSQPVVELYAEPLPDPSCQDTGQDQATE